MEKLVHLIDCVVLDLGWTIGSLRRRAVALLFPGTVVGMNDLRKDVLECRKVGVHGREATRI